MNIEWVIIGVLALVVVVLILGRQKAINVLRKVLLETIDLTMESPEQYADLIKSKMPLSVRPFVTKNLIVKVASTLKDELTRIP